MGLGLGLALTLALALTLLKFGMGAVGSAGNVAAFTLASELVRP